MDSADEKMLMAVYAGIAMKEIIGLAPVPSQVPYPGLIAATACNIADEMIAELKKRGVLPQ